MSTKASAIGSAEGSIIAAIITAHMPQMASALAALQCADAGIVSCATGWFMSNAIHARATQPTALVASSHSADLGCRTIRAQAPCAAPSAKRVWVGTVETPFARRHAIGLQFNAARARGVAPRDRLQAPCNPHRLSSPSDHRRGNAAPERLRTRPAEQCLEGG